MADTHGLFAYTTASAHYSTFTPQNAQVVVIPSDSADESFASHAALDATRAALEPAHASEVETLFFPAPTRGFVIARIIDNARKLSLQWSAMSRPGPDDMDEDYTDARNPYEALDSETDHPAVHFLFPDRIVPHVVLSQDSHTSSLFAVVLTEAGVLYRLTFPAPDLFYANQLPQDFVQQYQVRNLHEAGRAPVILHSLDSDSVLIATTDGTLVKCSQDRIQQIQDRAQLHADEWNESILSTSSKWSLTSWAHRPHAQTPATSSFSTSSPAQTISLASLTNRRGILDTAFSISRDKKLRIWSLTEDRLINTFNLDQIMPTSTALDYPDSSEPQQTLFEAIPRPLIRVVLSTDLESDYAAFLILFNPSPLARRFYIYGIQLDDSGSVKTFMPLGEQPLPDEYRLADLRDFQVVQVNPRAPSTLLPLEERSWTLWALWDEAGSEKVTFVDLPPLRGEGPRVESWTPLIKPNADGPSQWTTEYFDEQLASVQDGKDLAEVFMEHVFHPGRYSIGTLEYALKSYMNALLREVDQPVAILQEYETVEEKIAAVVGCSVRLEKSQETGAPLYEEFYKAIRSEWLRFTAMCNTSAQAAMLPLCLVADEVQQLVLIHTRDSIVVPIAQDGAPNLRHLLTEPSEALSKVSESMLEKSYPALASLATRSSIIHTAQLGHAILASLPFDALAYYKQEVLALLRKPVTKSMEDLIGEINEPLLLSYLADHQEELSHQCRTIANLPEALQAYVNLLGSPFNMVESGETATDSPSALSAALLANATAQILEERVALAFELLAFLSVLYHLQAVPVPGILKLFSQTTSCLHALSVLQWTAHCSQTAAPPQDPDSSSDMLLHKFDHMRMANSSNNSQIPSFSLLHTLFRLMPYTPLIRSNLTAIRALPDAIGGFLMSTGIISNKHLLSTQSADVLFLYQLLQAGLPETALSLAEMFPSDPALMYLLGSIYLDLGRTDDAKDAFDSASSALDDEDEMALLPSEARTPEKYYNHVAELFYQQAADSETLHFCCLSISHFSSETDQGFKREVTHRAFQSAVKLALFERAYSILIALPTSELQNDCLRTLISHMSEAGQVDLLLRLPFIGLRNELESQLEFRSRNEDPRSPLCFAKFLYSYYLSRSDYRKAAGAMYLHARRLAEVASRSEDASDLVRQQCQAYLVAINALSLVEAQHAWITAMPSSSRRKRRKIQSYIPAEEFAAECPDSLIVDLEDIRQEYNLCLAKLVLANDFPQLRHSTAELDRESAVSLYSQTGRIDNALAAAEVLNVNMDSIFQNLTSKCIQMSKPGAHHSDAASSMLFVESDANSWEGTPAMNAWHLLRVYLERYDKNNIYREKVLDRLLKEAPDSKLPSWLLSSFIEKRPDLLIRKTLRVGLIDESLRQAVALVQIVSKPTAQARTASCLPWSLFDELLVLQGDDGVTDLQEQLRKGIKDRLKGLQAISTRMLHSR